jgi:hypothetical protein
MDITTVRKAIDWLEQNGAENVVVEMGAGNCAITYHDPVAGRQRKLRGEVEQLGVLLAEAIRLRMYALAREAECIDDWNDYMDAVRRATAELVKQMGLLG